MTCFVDTCGRPELSETETVEEWIGQWEQREEEIGGIGKRGGRGN